MSLAVLPNGTKGWVPRSALGGRSFAGRISHGCVRLTNPAIQRLGKLMGIGTRVTIK